MFYQVFSLSALLFLSFSIMAPTNSVSKESLHDKMSGQGYGTAGCGLGSIAFGQKKGMIQVVAGTLNNISGNQTFGISSGTSNCEQQGKMNAATKQKVLNHYVKSNRIQLQNDIARSEGEGLDNISKILDCKDSKILGKQLQRQYANIFDITNKKDQSISQIIINVARQEENCRI